MTNAQENIIFLGRDPHLEKGEVSSWEEKESVSGWYRKMNIFFYFSWYCSVWKTMGTFEEASLWMHQTDSRFYALYLSCKFFSGLCSICPISYLSSQPLPISLGPFGLLPARPLSQGPVRSSWNPQAREQMFSCLEETFRPGHLWSIVGRYIGLSY